MKLYKNGYVLMNHTFSKMDFIVKDNRFFDIQPHILENAYAFKEIIDLSGMKVYPGLFEIHTHGLLGEDFNISSEKELEKALEGYQKQGVTSLYPTVMTDDPQTMVNQLNIIYHLSKRYSIIKGIHLEGPFLNPLYKGAMPESFLRKPSIEWFDIFNDAAQGLIKILTISPELDDALELIKHAKKHGVVVSIGHSAASYEEALLGIEAGASSFTHTFNAMKLSHQHDPNVMGAALLSDCYTEVISDGFHVHPKMVKLLVKTKGIDKVIGITDSMMAAGLGDGEFMLGVNHVTVKDGDATITDTGVRAGSTLLASECLKNLCRFCDIDIEYAIDMMTKNPAKLLGVDHEYGEIKIGYIADFFIE